MSAIADPSLAPSGERKIRWVMDHMPLLNSIAEDFAKTRPLEGVKITLSVHLEAKTAYLCRVLALGGAKMAVTGSNPLSTQDDVAAALVQGGLEVFAHHGCTDAQYWEDLRAALAFGPNVVVDDGGDLVWLLHTERTELLPGVIGGCEETTTGIHRLRQMAKAGTLRFPMVMVNEADCKHLFDNRYGTGQSVWDGIDRTTNLIVAGKRVVVAGYGWCGKGVAMRARGLGARVIVTEVDPVRAIEAHMDGFEVMPMAEAAPLGDVFVTVTGCSGVIRPEHFVTMRDGAILTNAGHFDVEVDMAGLRELAEESWVARQNIRGYRLPGGRKLYAIAEGRLVNLASGDGHPAEIMDMSFAIQALSVLYLVQHRGKLAPDVIPVPAETDRLVAFRKLQTLGIEIDSLSEAQRAYLGL
ncbi:MAG: adenosylhomocysteinase [Oscillospiraceae bacterium]|nr:adenosylhomocysteinase [Oscillospiraceae bacterium]